jgi:hypothetical protein
METAPVLVEELGRVRGRDQEQRSARQLEMIEIGRATRGGREPFSQVLADHRSKRRLMLSEVVERRLGLAKLIPPREERDTDDREDHHRDQKECGSSLQDEAISIPGGHSLVAHVREIDKPIDAVQSCYAGKSGRRSGGGSLDPLA